MERVHSTAAALVLLLAICLTLNAQTTDANFDRLAEAVKAISQERLSQAEALLNSVLASSPNDADANNLLGVIRGKQGRPADAERLFRRALASSPSHLSAHINLGELLLTTNRPAQAMQVLLRAHKLAPERVEINLNLATLYAEKRDYQKAREYLTLVPRDSLNDNYLHQYLYGLGVVSAALKEYVKAEEHLTAALAIKPNDVATLRALARVARSTGNLEKSLSHLVHARRVAPDSPAVLYDFGVTTLQMDLLLDALPAFERLHRDYPREPAYLYALAAVHWRKGETVETTRLMNNYVALQPRDPSGFYLLGAALLRQDLFPRARVALERSLSLKADPETEYLLGVCLEKLGNRVAAIETFRRVVRARPGHAAAFSALGSAYREAGNFTEARAALERAVELDPNDLRAHYQLGLVYAKLGDKEAAKRMLARADDLRGRQRNQESVILKLIDTAARLATHLLCATSSVSVVVSPPKNTHHRDTEDTEVAQRNLNPV